MAEKNQKRNDILTAARVLFREKGFHNTKMDEIAQKAGVGKGTLYEYFKNKQEIFDEVCVEYVKAIQENILELKNMDVSFNVKINLLFKNRQNTEYEDFEKNPLDYIMAYKNLLSDKVLKLMFNYITDINKIIIEIINQGKDEGVVRKDIPSPIIACTIIGTIGEYFSLKARSGKDINCYDDTIINLLFDGFGVK